MAFSELDIANITGAFTIAGVLIGGYISHRFAVIKMTYDTRLEANSKLRAAFGEELAILQRRTVDEIETCSILEQSLIKHQMAVNDFLIHLRGKEASLFSEAWLCYYGYHEHGEKVEHPFFEKYFHHNDKAGREKAIENIQAILSFANPPTARLWYKFWF